MVNGVYIHDIIPLAIQCIGVAIHGNLNEQINEKKSRSCIYLIWKPLINRLLSLLLLLLFGVRCAKPGESENTLSVHRPQPHTTNSWKEEEEDKIVGDTKERSDHADRKALTLLLKPASPTPSNTGSLR